MDISMNATKTDNIDKTNFFANKAISQTKFEPKVGFVSLDYTSNIKNKQESKFSARVRSLFRAIILQGYIDLKNNFTRTEDIVAKSQALDWFNITNENFLNTCYLAQYSPKVILNQALKFKNTAQIQLKKAQEKRKSKVYLDS